jgi:DNA-binding beta-propeller fold protein YncE
MALFSALVLVEVGFAVGPSITSFTRSGALAWTNALVPGVCTIEATSALGGEWLPVRNYFSTNASGSASVASSATQQFFRLRSVEVSATAQGFTNLVQAYGLLETVAGIGAGQADGVSFWMEEYEGGPASAAALSRPHYAMADRAGNIYIADKNSHSVLRVATNGTIHTHAGTHVGGFNGEGPASALELHLNLPNALWVRADGTVYVLDTENARVRRVTTNGIMSTLFNAKSDVSTGLGGGRCLWVKDDETLAYFGNTDRLRKWTPSAGLQTLANGFTELGTFYVEPSGNLVVADRGGHYVYRVTAAGVKMVIAGNGTPSGGGDGFPALQTGLFGPRGVWPVPTGGYLFLLHDGSQLWYMDSADTMHLLINGAGGTTHNGDGFFFYDLSELKISEGRSVALDYYGNILICESDYGFVRRIRFQRLPGN